MVATTTTTYTLLYYGHLNNLTEIPPILALMDLPEFLQPPPATLGHDGRHEVELILEPAPLLEYIPLLDLQPMSPNLSSPVPIVLEVPIINISLLNSLAPTMEHHQSIESTESDPLEELP